MQSISKFVPWMILLAVVLGGYWLSRSGGNPCTRRISYDSINQNRGIDLDSLFAPPSPIEIQQTLNNWKQRPIEAIGVELIQMFPILGGRTAQLIKHEVGDQTHYGALFLPRHFSEAPPASLPIVLFAFGLDQKNPEVSIYHSAVQQLLTGLDSNCILVLPSYRGQSLRLHNQYYCSDGFFGDAFDGATDDALALINVCIDQIPAADTSKIAVMGASRGGTVALLCGIRDPRIQLVIDMAGPTNFLNGVFYRRYPRQFKYQFLSEEGAISDLRRRMLASSPFYFSEYLPDLCIVHGENDPVVPLEQAKQLMERIANSGNPNQVSFVPLPDTGHELNNMDRYIQWINDWILSE